MSKRNRPPSDARAPRPAIVRRPSAEPPRSSPSPSSPASEQLRSLFEAERTVRRLHRELSRGDRASVLAAAAAAVAGALREADEREASLRQVCLAQVLGQFTGEQPVDLLIDLLGSDSDEGRQVAGEVLTEMAFDRFKEVALGVERALGRLPATSVARQELPFVLFEIPEPGVAKLYEKMLKQSDAEAVAATIEACAELGDRGLLGALQELREDRRLVEMEDDEGETDQVELGQLATEACDILQGG